MRVYHFLNEEYGLESIEKRRLKISRFDDLNDPFEFFAIELTNKSWRKALQDTKSDLAKEDGMLCFSKSWHSPLLWGHYADKHRGLCLGFDVIEKPLIDVTYIKDRIDELPSEINEETMRRWISTKYVDWAYEDETRAFLNLNDICENTGHYFSDYSSEMELKKVIVGCESKITRRRLNQALGSKYSDVIRFKARASFKKFKILKNQNQKLWK